MLVHEQSPTIERYIQFDYVSVGSFLEHQNIHKNGELPLQRLARHHSLIAKNFAASMNE